MTAGFFVSGTDTGVGKTCVSVMLLEQLCKTGRKAAGMKPVASGCTMTAEGLRNEDALRLLSASSLSLDYPTVNPFAFEQPVAPHLAAQLANQLIEINKIQLAYDSICQKADTVIVEGVGGWLVPINATETMADVAQSLDLPVILVVGIRLGCLNHALLSMASIKQSGLSLAGWVANRLDNQCLLAEENIRYLQRKIHAPLLADIPWIESGAGFEGITLPDTLLA